MNKIYKYFCLILVSCAGSLAYSDTISIPVKICFSDIPTDVTRIDFREMSSYRVKRSLPF
jgi:hypothetical protein